MSKTPSNRSDYHYFTSITTRWSDNDIYGHVNNVTYYSYFDSAANQFLIEQGGLDIANGPVIGYVVNSACNYFSAIAYPEVIEAGMRVDRIGNSSVQYGLAIFKQGEEKAAAEGHFVHVFVDRETEKSVSMPAKLRSALETIQAT